MFQSVCRVCFASDVRTLSLNVQFMGIYEKLSSSKLSTDDDRSNTLCYICYSHLQKCIRFCNMAQKSEEYWADVQESNLKGNDERIHKLYLVKLQTLSVINLKPIYLDGLGKINKSKLNLKKTQLKETSYIDAANQLPTNEGLTKYESPPKDLLKNIITIEGIIEYATPTENILIKNETKGAVNKELMTEVLTTNEHLKEGLTKNETTSNEGLLNNKLNNMEGLQNDLANNSINTNETTKGVKKVNTIGLTNNVKIEDELMETNDVKTENELMKTENSEDLNCPLEHSSISMLEDSYVKTLIENNELVEDKDYVLINDTEMYYACDVCHNIFKTREDLATHRASHKTEPKETHKLEDILEKLPNTKEPYCPICKKFFAGYDSQLQEHLRIHTGERPFICDYCGKTSRTKHHFKEHVRTHTKEKVYCNVCKKGFSQMSSLGKHMVIHSGETPYCCHICGKSFRQNGQMKAHIRFIHEGVRPFGCDVCGQRFPAKSEWRRHMDAHSGIKAHSCDKCQTKFATNAALVRHKKSRCKLSG